MIDTAKVLMFYDGACPLCSREVAHYRRLDKRRRIQWLDISRQPELLSLLEPPVSYAAAMSRLHVRDTEGLLHTGVAAFACLWRELPYYRWLSRVVSIPLLTPLLDAGYDRVTRWRLRGRCLPGDGHCR